MYISYNNFLCYLHKYLSSLKINTQNSLILNNYLTNLSIYTRNNNLQISNHFPSNTITPFLKFLLAQAILPIDDLNLYKYDKLNAHFLDAIINKRAYLMPINKLNDLLDYVNDASYPQNNYMNYSKVFCSSTSDDNLLNWSHHADNYSGVCYSFRLKDTLIDLNKKLNDCLIVYGPVNYVSSRTLLLPNNLQPLLKNDYYLINNIILVFNKNNDFAFEKEFRILLSNNEEIKLDYAKLNIERLIKGFKDITVVDLLKSISPNIKKERIYLSKAHYKIRKKDL